MKILTRTLRRPIGRSWLGADGALHLGIIMNNTCFHCCGKGSRLRRTRLYNTNNCSKLQVGRLRTISEVMPSMPGLLLL
eukprot:3356295-Amphidinium_carterae.1